MSSRPPLDLALVGGGLQNGLIALATLAARPDARLAIFERGPALGGNHTWCFHAGDLPDTARPWVEPLAAHVWPGYEVRFPAHQRYLSSTYACITAATLDQEVRAAIARAPNADLHLGAEVMEVGPSRVVVRDRDGVRTVLARTVVDARGPEHTRGAGGWQKFVGVELRLPRPHGVEVPLLMDATVPQLDGFRFLYVLPLAPDRLLVEDTCFSDEPALDVARVRTQALAYAAAQGWTGEVVREEQGVLPMSWDVDVVAPVPGLITAGYQGGWFHPVTGYSFPIALRVASAIGAAIGEGGDPAAAVAALVPAHRAQLDFAARLVWMMFRWFEPEQRSGVLEHFYRLPEDTVLRFYALAMTGRDRVRMFLRRPPRGLSFRRAVAMRRRATMLSAPERAS